MSDLAKVTITTHAKLYKYAEGADPATATPIEVIDGPEQILTGQAADDYLNKISGGDTDGSN
jgi:hypothetical protein